MQHVNLPDCELEHPCCVVRVSYGFQPNYVAGVRAMLFTGFVRLPQLKLYSRKFSIAYATRVASDIITQSSSEVVMTSLGNGRPAAGHYFDDDDGPILIPSTLFAHRRVRLLGRAVGRDDLAYSGRLELQRCHFASFMHEHVTAPPQRRRLVGVAQFYFLFGSCPPLSAALHHRSRLRMQYSRYSCRRCRSRI